jgi:hypothetical protein
MARIEGQQRLELVPAAKGGALPCLQVRRRASSPFCSPQPQRWRAVEIEVSGSELAHNSWRRRLLGIISDRSVHDVIGPGKGFGDAW